MTVEATIIRTEPDTEYQGTVYDQNVIVELSDGTRLGLFDPDAIVDSTLIGKTLLLTITASMFDSNPEKVSKPTTRVSPSSDQPLFWRGHVYQGRIAEILSWIEDRNEIRLDIGIGTMIVRPRRDEIGDMQEGDYMRVKASRSDIIGIERL